MILGPLIFVFYINDVIRNIANLRVNVYADDSLIYTIGNDWERMVPKIQNGLNSFQNWCVKNNMKLNVKKSKSLVIGTTFKITSINIEFRFVLNNTYLERVSSYNYLGVILDTHMTLNPLFILSRKIRNNVTLNGALAIYKQTILPFLITQALCKCLLMCLIRMNFRSYNIMD